MRREHVRPLVAFVLVTVTCAVIVLHGLMAGAVNLWGHAPKADDHLAAPVTSHAARGSSPTARVSSAATSRATSRATRTSTSSVERVAPIRAAGTTQPHVSADRPDVAPSRPSQPAPAVVRTLDDVTPVVPAAEDVLPAVDSAASRTVGAAEAPTR